ncbi:MAG: methyltransferase domain-containing protein [Acetobacteraceae bacterium]|nr:methyltransferase domain-containing protein [Acetobacteraceae bacterium]
MHRQDDGATHPETLTTRLTRAAVTALEQRRPGEALPSLDRLRLLPGQSGLAAALRAEALLALGRSAEADGAAAEALEERPDDPGRLELRARAHWACGRSLDALDTAAAAVLAGPRDVAALLLFAALLSEERRFEDAASVLDDALGRRPDEPEVLLRLGIALTRADRHAEAEAMLARCHGLAPALPGLGVARAQAALARKDVEAAITIARAALEQVGADAALYSVLAHALEAAGRREEARPAIRAAARLAPEDPYLSHLAAIADSGEAEAPDRASAGYVEAVFDGYAGRFEAALIRLGYRVPGLVRRAMERHRPGLADGAARLGAVLDLGCGTGLVGVALHDLLGGRLVGVDLSRRMLEEARAKGIYDELLQQDLLAVLGAGEETFDLVCAADVFCYMGRLDEVLGLCARRLAPEGLLIFSVERGAEGSGYALHGQGRYRHAPDLVRADLAGAGLAPLEMREEVLRTDFGRPVDGLLVVARRGV